LNSQIPSPRPCIARAVGVSLCGWDEFTADQGAQVTDAGAACAFTDCDSPNGPIASPGSLRRVGHDPGNRVRHDRVVGQIIKALDDLEMARFHD
jgi:hypothetical protein